MMLTVGHQCDAEVIKLMLKVAEPIVKVFSVQSNSFRGKKNPMSLLINSRLLFSVLVLQTNDIAETLSSLGSILYMVSLADVLFK